MKITLGFLKTLPFFSLVVLTAWTVGCNGKVTIAVPHQSLNIREGENLLVSGKYEPSTSIEYQLKSKKNKRVISNGTCPVDSFGLFMIQIPVDKYGKYILSVNSQDVRWKKSKVNINVLARPYFYYDNKPEDSVELKKDLSIEIRDNDSDLNIISVDNRVIFSKFSAFEAKPSKFARKIDVTKKLMLSRNDITPDSTQVTISIAGSRQESIALNVSVPGQIKIEAKDKYSKPSDKPFELIVDIF